MTDSIPIDATNDPQRRSWLTSANRVDGDFPKWLPVGYHGRSSSIEISGQQFNRPVGQRLLSELIT